MMQPKGDTFVFLNEVQFFRDWPLFVKAHHESKKVRFVVTGSNAAMVSSDMITLLSGRSLPLEVFPFSFRELAGARGIDIENRAVVARQKQNRLALLDEYLYYGGFPTVATAPHKHAAYDILGAHARTVLLQDVAPRLGVRKPSSLEQLYVYLVSHIGKFLSYRRLGELFDLTDKSVKEYMHGLAGSHMIYEVEQFSFSLQKQVRSPKKVYAIDTGQANAMGFQFSANRGRLLENLIFVDLKRLGLDVYYFKTKQDREVDFVVKSGSQVTLVQVTWDMNDPDSADRELRALESAMRELRCPRALLIVAEPLLDPLTLPSSISILSADQYLLLGLADRRSRLFDDQ